MHKRIHWSMYVRTAHAGHRFHVCVRTHVCQYTCTYALHTFGYYARMYVCANCTYLYHFLRTCIYVCMLHILHTFVTLCTCVCVYVYTYVCTYCTHSYHHVCVYSTHSCHYLCVYCTLSYHFLALLPWQRRMYVCMYVHILVPFPLAKTHVCMYVCVCVYVWTHIRTIFLPCYLGKDAIMWKEYCDLRYVCVWT
jgi:hypothetical protein